MNNKNICKKFINEIKHLEKILKTRVKYLKDLDKINDYSNLRVKAQLFLASEYQELMTSISEFQSICRDHEKTASKYKDCLLSKSKDLLSSISSLRDTLGVSPDDVLELHPLMIDEYSFGLLIESDRIYSLLNPVISDVYSNFT